MTRWPSDNQKELIAFYGLPGKQVESQLISVVPPWQMYYDGKKIKSFRFHKKAAPALVRVLNRIWEKAGRDQSQIEEWQLHEFNGTYNPRKVRGSATKWSNHAFGAALDLGASENGLGKKTSTFPREVIEEFAAEGFRWGGNYKGRKDPMHFEACCNASVAEAEPIEPIIVADADQADGDVEVADETANGTVTLSARSKKPDMAKVGLVAAGGVGAGATEADPSWFDNIMSVVQYLPSKPSFWIFLAIAGFGLYLIYRDHWRK